MQNKRVRKKKVLVVVAHPDDELLWMGGTLLMNKDKWSTTIISLCRGDDRDRAPKFRKICKTFYKTKCFISDLEDEKLKSLPTKEVIKRIGRFVDDKSYDFVFTHGKNGEYGHARHKLVHQAVVEMLRNRDLKTKKVFLFDYAKRSAACIARARADKFINLNRIMYLKKKYLIQNVYGFKKNGFEDKCCAKTESFKIKNIK